MLVSSLARSVGRLTRPDERRAIIIPPATAGSLGDAAMITAAAAALRARGMDDLELFYGPPWPVDGPPLRPVAAERFFYGGSRPTEALLMARLTAASGIYFVGADVIDGAYTPRSVVRRLRLLADMAQMGRKATVLGSSFNAHPEASCLQMLRDLPPSVRLCARDPVSKVRMETALARPVEQVADLAFLVAPRPEHPVAEEAIAWIRGERQAGRAVLALNANYLHNRVEGYAAAMQRLLGAMLDRDASILLTPHDTRTDKSDEVILLEVQRRLSDARRERTRLLPAVSPGATKAALGEVDLILSGRMHAAILGMGAGTPAFCFAYQDKFEGLYELLELGDAGLLSRPEALVENVDDVIAGIDRVLRETTALRQRLAGVKPKMTALAELNFA